MMTKNRVKLVVWLGLLAATGVAIVLTLKLLGGITVFFSSGADRESALNIVPAVPPDLAARVDWLPDHPDALAGRRLDPLTRDRIAGAYIEGWTQVNISHELGRPYGIKTYFSGPALDQVTAGVEEAAAGAWTLLQSNLHHELELTFYSDDGSIAALTDHNAEFVRYLRPGDETSGRIFTTRDAYDLVMLLEDGNWRVRFMVRRGDGALPYVGDVPPAAAELTARVPSTSTLITVDGAMLRRGGEPFRMAGVNYYPRATAWTLFWSAYDPVRTRVDLAVVRSLGLNTVRIFVPFDEFGLGDAVDEETLAALVDFLDQAEAAGVGVVVTLFDHRTDHHPANWAADQRYLAQVVRPLAGHNAIAAWDVKNEPDRDYGFNTPELTNAWLTYMAELVRAHDPHHLITIGWSSPEAAAALPEVVDMVAYHFFAPAEEYVPRVTALRAAVGDKPLLLEEFGLPTWNSIFPNGHTEAEQALYYAGILGDQRQLDTAGYLAWTLYDFTEVALGEFLLPWQKGPQAHMGLIRTDYTYKPAAALVAPDAPLVAAPIPAWQRFVKPFWLMLFAMAGCFFLLVIAIGAWLLLRRERRQRPKFRAASAPLLPAPAPQTAAADVTPGVPDG